MVTYSLQLYKYNKHKIPNLKVMTNKSSIVLFNLGKDEVTLLMATDLEQGLLEDLAISIEEQVEGVRSEEHPEPWDLFYYPALKCWKFFFERAVAFVIPIIDEEVMQ
jgi:hypothetical protein